MASEWTAETKWTRSTLPHTDRGANLAHFLAHQGVAVEADVGASAGLTGSTIRGDVELRALERAACAAGSLVTSAWPRPRWLP